MKPDDADDLPIPEPANASLLDRLALDPEGQTRSVYEEDRPLIESEGVVLVERLAPGRVTLYRSWAGKTFWDNFTIVVTRERLRIYTGRFQTLVDVSLTDPDDLGKFAASLDRRGRLSLRVPRGTGRGPTPRARANRTISIKSSRAPEILDLIRNARIKVLGRE
jgi:hypothetical protein